MERLSADLALDARNPSVCSPPFPIQLIAENGMASLGEMNANLMGSPGFELHLQQGGSLETLAYDEGGLRGLAGFDPSGEPLAVHGVTTKERGERPALRRPAVNDCEIRLAHLTRLERALQCAQGE